MIRDMCERFDGGQEQGLVPHRRPGLSQEDQRQGRANGVISDTLHAYVNGRNDDSEVTVLALNRGRARGC